MEQTHFKNIKVAWMKFVCNLTGKSNFNFIIIIFGLLNNTTLSGAQNLLCVQDFGLYLMPDIKHRPIKYKASPEELL